MDSCLKIFGPKITRYTVCFSRLLVTLTVQSVFYPADLTAMIAHAIVMHKLRYLQARDSYMVVTA